MRWSRVFVWFLALVLAVGLVGCGADMDSKKEAESGSQETHLFPVEVEDSSGEKVTIEKEPKRIVSIIPGATEVAFALGLGDRIVGVTENDNYPSEVEKIEKVGDMTINTEKVVALQPDLVLASPLNGETVDQLRKLGLTVLSVDGQNLDEVYKLIRLVGKATGTGEEAEKVISQMEQEKKAVSDKVALLSEKEKLKVWIEVSPELYTAGKGSFMDELVTFAGGKNVAGDQEGWPQVSAEKVVEWNPDVIILMYGAGDKGAIEKVASRKGWQSIEAVKSKRIVPIDTDMVSRPGPRLTEGLQKVAEAIHPEHFKVDE